DADRPQRLDRLPALHALDVAVLVAHSRAGTGLDEDPLPVRLDEQQVQPAEQAPAVIGLDEPAPERLRDDPEEATGIRSEPARADDPHAHSARVGAGRADLVQRLAHDLDTR